MDRHALPPESPVYAKIAEMCRPLYFDDVAFEPLIDLDGSEILSVTGMMPLQAGGKYLTVWRDGADDGLRIMIHAAMPPRPADSEIHEVQKDDKFLGLDPDALENAKSMVPAAGVLVRLFETAEPGHRDLAPDQREESMSLLNAACMGVFGTSEPEALKPSEHEHGEPEPWYRLVDQFTGLCRGGPLHQVELHPSPYGGVDITAHIWPPLLEEKVAVRVFHHQGPGEDLPGHWYGVGDRSIPAHAAFVDFEGLCAEYPATSHAFIEHALDGHLHAMAHFVYEVIDARLTAKVEFLSSLIPDEDERYVRAKELAAPEWQDSLAGFQGIAMMFTGSVDELD